MNIGVLLSGNGVFDGSELQETVFALAAIDRHNATAVCMAPNINQHHVVNHVTGEPMPEQRNVLVEAARVARGNIKDVDAVQWQELDALVLPGGFGAAKNLTSWAFDGPSGTIHAASAELIQNLHAAGKPLVALCMAPVVVAKALENSAVRARLTVGTSEEPTPYDIEAIEKGLQSIGALPHPTSVRDIVVDKDNRIITAPCYMMEARIGQIQANVDQAIDALFEMLRT